MKSFATLLLIYVSILSASPFLRLADQLNGCCETSCEMEQDKNLSNDNTCPFGACCCTICTVCYLPGEKFTLDPGPSRKLFVRTEQVGDLSDHLNDPWHPPEMV